MVVVRSCCCGCTLRQGTIGTGIVSVIESVLYFGVGAFCLNNLNPDIDDGEVRETVSKVFYIYGIISLVFGSIILAVTVFLFFAVHMTRRGLLLPWIVLRAIILALSAIGSLISFVTGGIIVAIVNIAWLGLMIYLFLVVLSYYQTDMEQIVNPGVVLAPGTGGFSPLQQPPGQHYVTGAPTAGGNVYVYPSQNDNPAGPPQYPAQSYVYNQQPQLHQSGFVHPPAYPGNVYSDEPQKSAV